MALIKFSPQNRCWDLDLMRKKLLPAGLGFSEDSSGFWRATLVVTGDSGNSGSSSRSSFSSSKTESVLLADDAYSPTRPRPGNVCSDASDMTDNTGENTGYWLVKTGLEGAFFTVRMLSELRTWTIATGPSEGGTNLSTRSDMDTIVKADNVPTLTCKRRWSRIISRTLHQSQTSKGWCIMWLSCNLYTTFMYAM